MFGFVHKKNLSIIDRLWSIDGQHGSDINSYNLLKTRTVIKSLPWMGLRLKLGIYNNFDVHLVPRARFFCAFLLLTKRRVALGTRLFMYSFCSGIIAICGAWFM